MLFTFSGALQWFFPIIVAHSKYFPASHNDFAWTPIYPEYGVIRTFEFVFIIGFWTKYFASVDFPEPSNPSNAIIFPFSCFSISFKFSNSGIFSGFLVASIAPNFTKVLYSTNPLSLALFPVSTISNMLSAHPSVTAASTLPDIFTIFSSFIPRYPLAKLT